MGHLTKKDEARIIKLIEEWCEPKLTWPLLVEACKTKLSISRARQSLMKLPAVDMAMKVRKAALKAPTEKPGWVKDIHQANERIEKLTEANQQLKAVNKQLLARFLTWQANADMHGVSQAMLDRPLVHFRK
ncbi:MULTISPECIES: hypothetical protein [Pseudomonadaceae]|uniref:Uncharacterized protein n=1 Tax=Pseudomonas moraviensis R28-S TaxID=1395516 RepID=V8R1B2_9PSED|nr:MULTISPECIES: hypothetical protein [Pseudomonadaceae]EKX3430941.1 hypothetical protein [Pseudomonas aeruginosa]HAJ85915.1 hypothetical protein [Pseudomonas sp.]ETF05926.1 hypothetical protein PMO01_23385 [Pseudomonas moraviensis R28-S]MDH0500709.1 hypothetical protein [Stutzerimonas stutzeri]MDH1539590.1 hypothetical protein [Stutzerimonas stutzeri]